MIRGLFSIPLRYMSSIKVVDVLEGHIGREKSKTIPANPDDWERPI